MDKESFERLVLNNIKRPGVKDLLKWVEQTDFYEAPASTRYHGSYEGGLSDHSAGVFFHLMDLCKLYECKASQESIAIVSLFHDFCKIGFYKKAMRWRKDKNDKWEQYATYAVDEDFAYGGHGSKSVFLVQSFMRLEPDEASAINCHMGAWDNSQFCNPSAVYERNPLAWLLHVADEAETYNMKFKEGIYE